MTSAVLFIEIAAVYVVYGFQINEATKILLLFFVVMLGLLLLTYWIYLKLKPVYALIYDLKSLSKDHLDVQHRFMTDSGDEFEELAKAMRDHFRAISESVRELSAYVNKLANSIVDIRGVFKKQLGTLPKQASSVHETVVTIEQLSASARSIAESSVNVYDAAVMTKDNNIKGLSYIQDILKTVYEIKDGLEARIFHVANLSKKFDEISETMKYIHTINDQTKLIAFNAAIEASSAGELSKRFNIVATDVRKLAQNIERSNSEIKLSLEEMRRAITDLVDASNEDFQRMDRTVQATREITGIFESSTQHSVQTSESARNITLSTHEQRAASQEVAATAKNISLSIDEFFKTSQNTARVVDDIEKTIHLLKTSISRFSV